MRSLLQHAAVGFAMGAGSFVLAALPSHNGDARTAERATLPPPAPSAIEAPRVVDVTAPVHEAPILRRLRTLGEPPRRRTSARAFVDRDPEASQGDSFDALDALDSSGAACVARDPLRAPREEARHPATPRADDAAAFFRDLRMPSLPVKRDPRVLKYVRHLTETPEGRATFTAALRRSGRYEEIVAQALEEHGLPSALLAVVFVESGCWPTAVSSAGATGLWQLMPATARAYGLAVDSAFDERRSLWRSTGAAAQHLADLYDRFASWDLALAAYNMGYKALVDRIEARGTDDFWELAAIDGALPSETLQYVPKVLATAVVLANLEEFGFGDVDVAEPIEAGELEVPAGVRLSSLARAARTSARLLHELNPELISDFVPVRGEPTVLHLPLRALGRARTSLARATDVEPDRRRARLDFGFDLDESRDGAGDEECVDRGRAIDDGFGSVDRRARHRSFVTERSRGGDDDGAEPAPRRRRPVAGRPVVFFRAGSGDTAASIARTFGLKEEQVLAQNGLDPERPIEDGMLLQLRVPEDVTRRLTRERRTASEPALR